MAFSVLATSSKSMPSAARRSFTPSTNPAKTSLTWFQIAVTFSRNSSFVCHRCTKAATSRGDHADDDEYRGGDAADGRTQLSHDPGSGAHGRLHLPDGSRELHEALHGHADLGYRGADDDEERPDGGHQQGDADDHLPLAVVHAVQLVDEGLNLGDDVADGGHQDVAEGYGQLLQLRLQDRQLAGEVVLHDTGHLLGGAVAVVDGALELRDVLRSRVHEREEAGHGVLADQRLGCLRLFRLRHLGEGDAAVGEDVVQVPHGAVCVRRLDGHVAEGCAGELQVALQLGHDGAKRGTGLAALDSGVRHEADGLAPCPLRSTP